MDISGLSQEMEQQGGPPPPIPSPMPPPMAGGPPVPGGQNEGRMGGMTMPSKPSGTLEMAKVNVQTAMTLMEQVLQEFGSSSDEGTAIIKALQSLSKYFGKQTAEDLSNTQLQNMFAKMAPQAEAGMGQGGGMAGGSGSGGGGGMPPELMNMLMGKM